MSSLYKKRVQCFTNILKRSTNCTLILKSTSFVEPHTRPSVLFGASLSSLRAFVLSFHCSYSTFRMIPMSHNGLAARHHLKVLLSFFSQKQDHDRGWRKTPTRGRTFFASSFGVSVLNAQGSNVPPFFLPFSEPHTAILTSVLSFGATVDAQFYADARTKCSKLTDFTRMSQCTHLSMNRLLVWNTLTGKILTLHESRSSSSLKKLQCVQWLKR